MKKVDGILVNANDSQMLDYKLLKEDLQEVLASSGELWNWPMLSALTRPTLGRILQMHKIYEQILEIPGSVCEFGVHYGASSNVLMNLKSLLEPHNSNRNFYLFDTFAGFVGTSPKDGNQVNERDFAINSENYDEFLKEMLSLHNRIRNDNSDVNFEIFKGDASNSVEEFLTENPHVVLSLVIFDMDVYAPTKKVLELVIPRLTKGSIVVIDQFNFAAYPGETIALMEVLELNKIEMKKSSFTPHTAWFRFV